MWWTVAKEAATNWSSHKDARQGAALAYYSVFSLGPIIVISIAIAGLFFGHEAVSSQVTSSLKEMLGDTGAKAIEAMLAGASRPAEGTLAAILGVGALLFAAIGARIYLWCGRIHRCRADLGLLYVTDHLDGGRNHSCLRCA